MPHRKGLEAEDGVHMLSKGSPTPTVAATPMQQRPECRGSMQLWIWACWGTWHPRWAWGQGDKVLVCRWVVLGRVCVARHRRCRRSEGCTALGDWIFSETLQLQQPKPQGVPKERQAEPVLGRLGNGDFPDGEGWELVISGTRGCIRNERQDLEVCVQLQGCDLVGIADMWWDSSHDWITAMDGCGLFRRNRPVW